MGANRGLFGEPLGVYLVSPGLGSRLCSQWSRQVCRGGWFLRRQFLDPWFLAIVTALVTVIVVASLWCKIEVVPGVVIGSCLTIYMQVFIISDWRLFILINYLSLWPRASWTRGASPGSFFLLLLVFPQALPGMEVHRGCHVTEPCGWLLNSS